MGSIQAGCRLQAFPSPAFYCLPAADVSHGRGGPTSSHPVTPVLQDTGAENSASPQSAFRSVARLPCGGELALWPGGCTPST